METCTQMATHPTTAEIKIADYCRVLVVQVDRKGGVTGMTPEDAGGEIAELRQGKRLPLKLGGLAPGGWTFYGGEWLAQGVGREELEMVLLRRIGVADRILGPYGRREVNEETVRILLDNQYEGLTVVDGEGRVTLLSPSNEKWFGLPPGGAAGLRLSDLSPNSRLPEVARSGKPERAQVLDLSGQTKVTLNLPLKRSGKVIGAVGRILFQSPAQVEELSSRVRSMELKVERYETLLNEMRGRRWTFSDVITGDPAMAEVIAQARRIAKSSATVLILGESGTGKELIAQALHEESGRRKGPFVAVNCAAIPKELIESELFGYEEGAFSGARRKGKPGKFELASGGTLFLDEIGELPMESQAKLLRALEEKKVERLGATGPVEVDFRLVAATNKNPGEMAVKGAFRSDLYYRLHEIPLEIPPLRKRAGDVSTLAGRFLDDVCAREGLGRKRFTGAALEALSRHEWPGNVRELRSLVRRLAWQTPEAEIDAIHLPGNVSSGKAPALPGGTLAEVTDRAERAAILAALAECGGSKVAAARRLGIHRTALYKKMAKLSIGAGEGATDPSGKLL